MPDGFDANSLREQLRSVAFELRVAFALLVAERLFPALASYSAEVHGTEASRVRSSLDELWRALCTGDVNLERLRNFAEEVWELRPETEDNPSELAPYALDAAAAAWNALEAAITADLRYVVEAASIAYDSAYLRAEIREAFEPEDMTDLDAVLTREVVRRELDTQLIQLHRVSDLAPLGRAGVALLHEEFCKASGGESTTSYSADP